MSDFNDPTLVFEHKLREHVRDVLTYIEGYFNTQGLSHVPSVSVVYTHDDEGKWRISCYYNRIDTSAQGAELHIVRNNFCTAFSMAHGAKTLRSLLPAAAPSIPIEPHQEGGDDSTPI